MATSTSKRSILARWATSRNQLGMRSCSALFSWCLRVSKIFGQFDLWHNNFFTVPARQAVEIWVGIDVFAHIYTFGLASGSIEVRFNNDGFLMCPFVELQVLPVQPVPVPTASSKRATNKKG